MPDVQGVSACCERTTGFDGSSDHLSQHWVPHHLWVHATQMLQPRVRAHSAQQSATDVDVVAPVLQDGAVHLLELDHSLPPEAGKLKAKPFLHKGERVMGEEALLLDAILKVLVVRAKDGSLAAYDLRRETRTELGAAQ